MPLFGYALFVCFLAQSACSSILTLPVYRAARTHKSSLLATATSQPLVDYMVNVTIGTPPQRFSVKVAQTISYLWVSDSSCQCPLICDTSISCLTGICDTSSECCVEALGPHAAAVSLPAVPRVHPLIAAPTRGDGDCAPKRPRFHSWRSVTYHKDGTTFNDTAPDMRQAGPLQGSGFMGRDDVTLGPLSLKKTMFGQAKKVHLDMLVDGVLGLGPSALNPNGIESPIVTGHKLGVIAQPIATVWLQSGVQVDGEIAGEIAYGGVDGARCGPVAVYHAISTTSDKYGTGWFVKATASMGTATVRPPHIHFDFTAGGEITLDSAYEKALLAGIGVTDAHFFDCSIKFDFTITIDGHDYVIPSSAVVTTHDSPGGECSLRTNEGETGQFVVGDMFAQHYCYSFDIGNNRLGFAKSL